MTRPARHLTIAAIALALCVRMAHAADDATLLRVFLKDGTSLVSYGEPARVDDRVVFSMPTAATPNPPLKLIDLSIGLIDWDRTTRYAAAARAARYIVTQGDSDYAALAAEVSRTLADVAMTADPARKIAILESATKRLADWPQNHFNYRVNEVRQMQATLEEAIADVRAATGDGRINLSLTAFVDPPTISEPLLPDPTPREAIEQVLAAARVVESPAERRSLLASAADSLERDSSVLPPDWSASTRAAVAGQIRAEDRIDRSYRALSSEVLLVSRARARSADVRGLERLMNAVYQRDAALGSSRPEVVNALVASVQEQLDAARRLRLARDRFALRSPVLHAYNLEIRRPIDLFVAVTPALESIKSLAGTSPGMLAATDRAVAEIISLASAVVPPEELAAAHALLVSAAQLASNAARIRREAVLANDMPRAWDASSAAAGALMLLRRARSEMQTLLRPPQLQ